MHTISKKIYYHDTDCGGVVYYANYLKYFEEARTEFLLSKDIEIRKLSAGNILFAVRRSEIDYKGPARYGDILIVTTKITKVKNVTLEFFQEAKVNDRLLVCAKTQMVCINSDFKPISLPDKVIAVLKSDL